METKVDNTDRLKHIKKAKKLLALAKGGHGGEMDNAKTKLDEHLLKYGIDISEIDETAMIRKFVVGSKEEYNLLTNIMLSVNPFCRIKIDKGIVTGDLDAEDYEEVKNKFKYFWNLWIIESDLRTLCFYTKHQEFLRPDQHAYDKHSDNGKFESPEIIKQKEEEIEMGAPKKENKEETPKQKMDRINNERMNGVLPYMINSQYYRGKKV